MFRKSMIALAAVATLAGTVFTATDASAKPMKLKWKGGYHGHHHRHIGPGIALGLIGAATIAAATAPRCYEVVNRYGYIVTRCRY